MLDPLHARAAVRVKSLRILMVTARFLPETGGIETHVYQVATRLALEGHDVTVLTTDRTATSRSITDLNGMKVVRVPAWPRRRDYYLAPGIYAEVSKGDWDFVHVQGCHTFVPVLAMAAAIRAGKRFVVSFHSGGHSSWLRNTIRRAQWTLLGPLFRRADHLIGVSRFEARSFSRNLHVSPKRFSVVFNGAEMPKVETLAGAKDNVIVSVARLEKYKGHHRIIAAMPALLERDPTLRLRIVGEGPYRQELVALARRLNVADRVEIAGVPPARRQELANILGKAALVVLLSEYEAHPIAVMEALACGAKVLVTNTGGLADLVEDGLAAGVDMDAGDDVVADHVWAEIQSNREVKAVHLPSWETCVDSLESIYLSVMEGRSVDETLSSPETPRRLVSSAEVGS